mmetsp:Transcript_130381/g.325260  ORF Transcript_130381/g.325260 Transcript_130381/m.325260 type:complete len:90 (+) Transcript_130381:109-378(+)
MREPTWVLSRGGCSDMHAKLEKMLASHAAGAGGGGGKAGTGTPAIWAAAASFAGGVFGGKYLPMIFFGRMTMLPSLILGGVATLPAAIS